MKLTPSEKETHLWYDLQERTWCAHTEIPAHARKFARLNWLRGSGGEWVGNGKSVTLRALISKTHKRVRTLAQEQASQRLAVAAKSRGKKKRGPRRGLNLNGAA